MRRVFRDRTPTADPVSEVRDPPADQRSDALQRALAPYGRQGHAPPERQPRGGRHARPARRQATVTAGAAVVLLGVASAVAVLWSGGDAAPQAAPAAQPALDVESSVVSGALLPGGTVSGAVRFTNRRAQLVQLEDVTFAPPMADACRVTGVSLAPTLPPTPESPLEVPAGGTASLEWTAYMDGESEDACQGATLTSVVTLDGEQAGTVVLEAAELDVPPAPTGGPTTSSRAAVRWSPSTTNDPGWVVERAVAGTDGWQPACGSSPQRPVRALSCTDTGLAASTAYVYRVTLRTGHWRATGPASRPVTTQGRPSA